MAEEEEGEGEGEGEEEEEGEGVGGPPGKDKSEGAKQSRFRVGDHLRPRPELRDTALDAANMLVQVLMFHKEFTATSKLIERVHAYLIACGSSSSFAAAAAGMVSRFSAKEAVLASIDMLPLDLQVRYGISLQMTRVVVNPLSAKDFDFSMGFLSIGYNATAVSAALGGGHSGSRKFEWHGVAQGAWTVTATGGPPTPASVGADGVLSFSAPVGPGVSVTATKD
jgi:hypothetical protein